MTKHVELDKHSELDKYLQLGLGLGLLEDRLHLGGLHDIALDLELARHEELLGVGLAGDERGKVGVGQGQRDGGLGGQALLHGARLLEVNVPAVRLAGRVLEGEGEDGVALLDGVLAVGLAAEGRVDGVKGGRGGELGCEGASLAGGLFGGGRMRSPL